MRAPALEKNRLNTRSMRIGLVCSLLLALSLGARGQESPAPEPTPVPSTRSARVSFLPPPLDGTISLGIYDAKGKLVRVLKREADINEFTIGTDALSTIWDGKNDAGEDAPAGKYNAHGFVVADLKVEGVGYFFNDFVTNDDSPRVQHLGVVRVHDDELHLEADLAGNERATLVFDAKQGAFLRKLPLEEPVPCREKPPLPNIGEALDCAAGVNGTSWFIDVVEGSVRREVKQLSATHDLLRRMSPAESDPPPQSIAASTSEDRVFLVEGGSESPVTRLRALRLAGSKTDTSNSVISDWKIDFEKKIVEHRSFSIENGKPVPTNPKNKTAQEKIPVKLQPNPLLADTRGTVEISVGLDEEGCFLKASDGLPLLSISETPNLVRGLLAVHGSNTLDIFQDDGAVVEQFRVSGVDQMMSFDCGGFELK